MKKVLFFALILLAAVSCKKNTDVEATDTDPRSKLVGDYSLIIKATIYPECDNSAIDALLPESKTFTSTAQEFKIEKDPDNSEKVIVSGYYNCKATVTLAGNLELESSQGKEYLKIYDYIDKSENPVLAALLKDVEIPLEYTMIHHTATLNGNKLTWTSEGSGEYSMSLGSYGEIKFSATVEAENTATKK